MNILIISGSRNPKGHTARAMNAVLEGAKEAGSDVELVFLPALNLERCRQCDQNGWGICKSKGRCVAEDDFNPLLEKMLNADVSVFTSPVYFSDLSESLYTFINKIRRISRNPEAQKSIENKPVAGICYAGGSGNGAPDCCASLYKILFKTGFDVVDMVPVRRQNLEAKLPALNLMGKWLGTKPTSS
jgi:multimeric flavodoxin WrbA